MDDYVRKINFQNFCDHVINREADESITHQEMFQNFYSKLNEIEENDLIFCRAEYMVNGMLRQIINDIPVPINLVIHGGDYLVSYDWLDSPKVKNLFCGQLNADLCRLDKTNKFSIPWGWGEVRHGFKSKEEFDFTWNRPVTKNNLLYIPNHTLNQYYDQSVRPHFLNELFNSNVFSLNNISDNQHIPQEDYYQRIQDSKFCIVIPGASWGDQPLRVWECLIRKTVPIMKRSFSNWWMSGLEQLNSIHGLPILFVDEWNEVDDILLCSFGVDWDDLHKKLCQNYWNDFITQRVRSCR